MDAVTRVKQVMLETCKSPYSIEELCDLVGESTGCAGSASCGGPGTVVGCTLSCEGGGTVLCDPKVV